MGSSTEITPVVPVTDLPPPDNDDNAAKPKSGAILRHPFGRIGAALILFQALYALFVPLKNVIIIPYPKVASDSVSTIAFPYVGMNLENDTMPSFKGTEIVAIMTRMVDIVFGSADHYQKLRAAGGLYPEVLLDFATADEFAVITQYISLVHQKAEFPSGRFLVRDEQVVYNNGSQGNVTLTIRCREQDKYLLGTRCRSSYDEPCMGWNMEDHAALQRVNITDAPFPASGNGWQNNIALSGLIGAFHDALRGVLTTQDWTQTYKDMGAATSYTPPFTADGKIFIHDWLWLPDIGMTFIGNNRVMNSCGGTEMLYVNAYVMEYALAIVDSYLRPRKMFKADQVDFPRHDFIEARMAQLLDEEYVITSGVKLISNKTTTTSLFGYTLTTLIESSASLKPFRPIDGPMVMGSSVYMLRRLAGVGFLGWVNDTRGLIEDSSIVSLGGSIHGGLQMFKDEWGSQSASVLKLRERTKKEGTGLDYNLFDRYEAYEDWYLEFDRTSPLSVSKFVKEYLGNNPSYLCQSAFVGSMARVLWVGIVSSYSFAVFSHYQWKLVSGNVGDWYNQHLSHVLEMVGENSAGQRVGVPYQLDPAFAGRYGASWPIFPLLATLRRNYTEAQIFNRVMPGVNLSWQLTQSAYQGAALFFDSRCDVGLSNPTLSDSGKFYPLLYPAVEAIIKRMIAVAPEINEAMNKAVAPMIVHPNAFVGSATYVDSNSLDTSAGAPFWWQHNALQLGLTKFVNFQFPTREVFRGSMEPLLVCFDTVEVRYLNDSVRCYTEYGAKTIKRVEKVSTLLKTLLTTNWAHGVVLNLMGAYAAFRFLQNLSKVYKLTQFQDVNLNVALNMFILGPDTIRVSELSVLAASNIPLLVGYHLPANPGFVEERQQANYWVAQVIVALSLTWYVRLGVEWGRRWVHLRYSNIWYETAMSRAQYLLLLIVFLARACVPEVNGDYTRGVTVLIFSIVLSTVLGFLLIVSTKLIDRQPAVMTPLDLDMLEHNVPRNWVGGCLSQSPEGWHVSGMIYENWYVGGDLLWFGPNFAIPITEAVRPYLAKLPKIGDGAGTGSRPKKR